MTTLIHRSPWQPDFPEVVIHSDLSSRNGHPAYSAAKSGDAEAAKRLVEDLLTAQGIEDLRALLAGQRPILLPITADELEGFNSIPDAMAQALGQQLGLIAAAGQVMQANKVGHTKANGWHRLVTPAAFTGEVTPGADYLLIDDHVGFGGTLANLRGFVQAKGGRVLGMTTLTETREARCIAVRSETLNLLQETHGTSLEQFWHGQFGHGLDCLTNIEAGYLCRVESVAAIKNRMAQAAEFARGRGLSPIAAISEPGIAQGGKRLPSL